MRWRQLLLWLCGALACLGLQAAAAGPAPQAALLAAQQDLDAARWDSARQRLLPLLAPALPVAVRAEAQVLLASSALRQGRYTTGVPHIRAALRLLRQPLDLPPPDAFAMTVGALHTATWLYAGAGLWPQALQAAHAGLQRSLRWQGAGGGPGGAETLEFRQVLLSHVVRQGRWGQAQQEVDALLRWLPADEACADDLCRRVQGHRLQLHKQLGENAAGYALALAIQRNPMPVAPEAAAWNALNLADLARSLERPREVRQWLDAALVLPLPDGSPARQAAEALQLELLAHTDGTDPGALAAARRQAGQLAERARLRDGLASAAHGQALLLQAELALRQGDAAASARLAAQGMAIAWAIDDAQLAWSAGQRLSGSAGQAQAMVFYEKLSVNAAQAVRAGTLDLPAQRQQSHLDAKREAYVGLADALLDQRRLPEAEQLLAMARNEDYHRLVRSTEPRRQRLAFSGPELPLAQALDRRREAVAQAAADWTRSLRPLGPAAEQGVQQALDAAVDALLAARQLPAAEAGSATAPALSTAADAADDAADDATPHVYYLPTPERLRIAVVVAGRTEVVDVPLREAALLRRIADWRAVLQNPARDARPQAQALHALLWAPIAPLLSGAAGSAVVLHPEGALRYLPFAALHDGRQWLVERHALRLSAGGGDGDGGHAPAAAAPRSSWALFGASRGAAGLPALPQVPGELAAIRQAAPAGTTLALDQGFTAARLRSALAQRRVVHIASHFVLAPGDSAASWLQLGGGARVSLAELAGPAFRFDGLDLLTLSACDTAVPAGVDARGRSLDSLAWLAHARGARNVLASLWPVPDTATAALMARFYAGLSAGQDKAEALRAAQLALLAEPGAGGAQPVRGLQAETSTAVAAMHPYYWGAFVLLAAAPAVAVR